MKSAVVLLSGGIDSTTCLAIAVDKYGKDNVYALNIAYGQKHKKELISAREVASHYGVDYTIIDLAEIMKFSNCSLLEHSSESIKHGSYKEQLDNSSGAVETYVPFRNGLMLSTAAAYAISNGAEVIYYGAHSDDSAGSAYPDCTPEFTMAMHNAIYEGSGKILKMQAPLLLMSKAEVVKVGLKLKAPYHLTWSCYEGKEKPCGECGTCIDRAKAFKENNLSDPAL